MVLYTMDKFKSFESSYYLLMNIRIKSAIVIMITALTLSPIGFGVSAQETNLGDILVRFCNDEETISKWWTKVLQWETNAGEEYEICMLLSNTSLENVTIGLNFVDGTVTADAEQRKACQPEGSTTQFGRYVNIDAREFEIEAGKTLQTYATIIFPLGYAGMSYGCVTSQLLNIESQQDPDSMFQIVSRRANFIDIFVDGKIELGLDIQKFQEDPFKKNLTNSEELAVFLDQVDGKYYASVSLSNPGTVKQNSVFDLTITDILGKEYTFPWNEASILPNQGTTMLVDISEVVQWYQGSFTATIDITYTPAFEFQSDKITKEMYEPKNMKLESSFLLIPWIPLGWVVALILIALIFLSGKKKDKEE